jgi:pimeloyl-[acyl-carrier protein] methyl ester esterase
MSDLVKPLLLFISGWGCPATAWRQTVAVLDPLCDCVVLDATDVLAGDTPIGVLRAALDSTRPCFLGGWSLGGMLALQHARALATDVSGLLLVSTTPHFCQDVTQSWGVPLAHVRAMRSALRNQPERILADFYQLAAAPFPDRPSGLVPPLHQVDRLEDGLTYLLDTDLRTQPACNGGLPTVLLHGRNDAVIPVTGSRTLAVQLMPSRLDLIVDVGHDLPLRCPDVLLNGIRSLIHMT